VLRGCGKLRLCEVQYVASCSFILPPNVMYACVCVCQHVNITNFTTSWNDGMAFCALIHHFRPESFDYSQLDPANRRYNFQLAFDTAEYATLGS